MKPTPDATPYGGNLAGDIIWQDAAGRIVPPEANTGGPLYFSAPLAVGGFNSDGRLDFYNQYQAQDGSPPVGMTMEASARKIPASGTGNVIDPPGIWSFAGIGDFSHDGISDVLLRGAGLSTGTFAIEVMPGAFGGVGNIQPSVVTFADPGSDWTVVAVADLNGDGFSDLLWQHADSTPAVWLMQGGALLGYGYLPNPTNHWTVVGTQDFNSDGKADVLWRGATGEVAEWLMDGTHLAATGVVTTVPGG